MKVRLALALALLVATSIPAFALGLGEIELNSALNQRLDATIHLVSVSRNELDSLQVGLASVDAFKRYEIERSAALSGLKFQVVPDGNGGAYVHVTSEDLIRDPFLTFLVEADWSNGRLLRQYTVLLDPPTFTENKTETAQAAVPVSSQPPIQEKGQSRAETETRTSGTVVSTPAASQAAPARHSMPQSTQPGTYGRIERGETLWGIARKLHQQSGASVNQMMVALYKANPRAFMGNMNRMKEGSILRVPKQDAIQQISRSDATQFVKSQDQAWRGGRSASSAGSASGTSAQSGGGSQAGAEKLTLEAPGAESAASESAAQGAGTGKVSKDDLLKLQNELADTKAELANSQSNNSELRAKVDGLQSEVERVRKLLSVKDDQLLALQQQVQQAGMQPAVKPEQTEAGAKSQSQTPPPAEGASGETAENATASETQQPAESGQAAAEETAQQPTPEASQTAEPAQSSEQQPTEAQPAAPAQPAPKREEKGFISSMLDVLMQPLVLIGLLVVVLLIGGLVVISRRQHSKAPSGVRGSQWVIAEEDETPHHGESEAAGEDAAAVAETAEVGHEVAGEDGHVDTLVGGKPVNLDEDDPLSEADFHMAYGLYDQAADGLKQAIQREPGRGDLRQKLLEVYFTAGNAEGFVDAAGDAKSVLGEGSEDWGKAVIMGKQLAPDDPMFADVGTASGVDLDFSSEDIGLGAGAESSAASEPEPAAENEFDVSMDFDTGSSADETPAPAVESPTPDSDREETLEFDIGEFGTDTGVGVGSQVGGSSASGDEDFDKALEELSAYVNTNLGEADSRLGEESEELSIEGPGGASEAPAEPAESAGGGDADEITTKLDLARAYIDMGDTDGARSILEEVMEDGGESHKQEAQRLLDQL